MLLTCIKVINGIENQFLVFFLSGRLRQFKCNTAIILQLSFGIFDVLHCPNSYPLTFIGPIVSKYFSIRMENNVDPDQIVSSEAS